MNKIHKGMTGKEPDVPVSFQRFIDKLHEIVVVRRWSGVISLNAHSGGISSATMNELIEETDDGGIVFKKVNLI